jgi:hypothetical protein
VKLVVGKENGEGGLGRRFSDRWGEKRRGPVLARCHAAGGVGGSADDHGNGRSAPNQERQARVARAMASKQGRGSNDVQIKINLN